MTSMTVFLKITFVPYITLSNKRRQFVTKKHFCKILFSFILLRPQNEAGSLLCATTTCLFNSAVKFNLGTNQHQESNAQTPVILSLFPNVRSNFFSCKFISRQAKRLKCYIQFRKSRYFVMNSVGVGDVQRYAKHTRIFHW